MAAKKKSTTGLDAIIERDLSALADSGELEPAFEVTRPIQEVQQLLRAAAAAPPDYRRLPLLVGEQGVGKSAVVRELVRCGGPPMDERRVVTLDFGPVVAAWANERDKEKEKTDAVEKVLDTLAEHLDELLVVVQGLGVLQEFAERKFINLLNDADFLVIVEAEPKEYRKLVEEHPDLARRFLPISLEEPEAPALENLLTEWAAHRKTLLGVECEPSAIEIAMELTNRFLPSHCQPRKAIDLLSAAASAAKKGKPLEKNTVVEWFSTIHAMPRFLVNPDEPLDLNETEQFFRERLIGQEDAVKAVLRMIATIKAGVGDVHRPLGTFLFVGPTGVGKTHIAQLLAEYLFGSRHAMLRFNMTDYADPHDASILFGNPWGDSMSDKQGVLSQRLVARPFGVLLLDELEKAHPLVLDRLFQLIDEGRYLNAAGQMVYATTVVIIATSNAGSQVFRERSIGFLEPGDEPELVRQMMTEIDKWFRFEFLNRFDQIVAFRPLRRGEIRELARRDLSALLERTGIKRRRLQVEVEDTVLDLLATHGYDPLYGARFLRREIERRVVGPMAEVLVRQNPPERSRLVVGVRGKKVTVQVEHANVPAQPVRVKSIAGEKVERLDQTALLDRAQGLLESAAGIGNTLREVEVECARLLEQTRNKSFWEEPARARATLETYRNTDLTVQAGKRVLRALERLRELSNADTEPERLARSLERAFGAMERWRDLTVDGGGPIWALIGPADALQVEPEFVKRLVRTYLSWSRRCGVDAEVVGEEVNKQGRLVRAALLADAPNARAIFAMERGVHRLIDKKNGKQRSKRTLVDVIPLNDDKNSAGRGKVRVRDAKHTKGILVPRVTARCTIEVLERGVEYELRGASRGVLETLGLAIASSPAPDHNVVRIYGEGGTGARDPRTGAVSARLRDVWSGDLTRFLSAWRDAPTAPPAT